MKKSFAKLLIAGVAALIVTACGDSRGSRTDNEATAQADTVTIGLLPSEPITIKMSVSKAKPWSKRYEPVQTIALDEDTEDIVGIPAAIVVEGDTLFIVEPMNNPGFRAYRHDGSQIFSYSSVGNGPEDIVSPHNLCVSDSLLSTFDYASKSLVFVDKKGDYVKRYKLGDFALAGIEDKSGGIWTDYTNQDFETTRLSWKATPDGEEIEVLPVPEHLKGLTMISMHHFTRICDGTVNYVPPLDPHVYSLLNGQVRIKYNLDYDGLWPDESEFKRNYLGNDWARKINSLPIQRTQVVENDRWLVISFEHSKGPRERKKYIHVYDKNESKGVTYKDDQDKYFAPQAISGNRLYIPTKEDTIEVIDLSIKE